LLLIEHLLGEVSCVILRHLGGDRFENLDFVRIA
jgi:hypothetical protein